jgi:hypothetical protein
MFARHYLRNLGWFLFLELLRCFSSLGSPPFPYIFRDGYPCGWVSPAFRRLSRPSSPVIAKASTICTYSLDPITLKPEPFLNSDLVAHETPAIGFLKQLLSCCKVVQHDMVYFTYICFKNFHSWNSCEQNVSILQSITTHLDISNHHNLYILFTSSILLKNSLVKN